MATARQLFANVFVWVQGFEKFAWQFLTAASTALWASGNARAAEQCTFPETVLQAIAPKEYAAVGIKSMLAMTKKYWRIAPPNE
jgi:hypothetical protein